MATHPHLVRESIYDREAWLTTVHGVMARVERDWSNQAQHRTFTHIVCQLQDLLKGSVVGRKWHLHAGAGEAGLILML